MDKQMTMGECLEIPTIKTVSSLNLRMGRKKERRLTEPISYRCSMCGRLRQLGKNAAVLSKISYEFHNVEVDYTLCDECLDVFVDGIQEGPRVFRELVSWRVRSRTARISLVQDHLFCFKCLGRSDTHIFFKYDDLRIGGKESYQTMRVCSRCVVSYLVTMKKSQCTQKNKYKVCQSPELPVHQILHQSAYGLVPNGG